MAKGTLGTIITWGVVGVGAWWVYENFFASAAAAGPSSGTAPTGTGPGTTVVSSPGGGGAAVPVNPPPAAPAQSLASIHTALQQAVASSGDPAITAPPTLNTTNPDYNFIATPDVFNYYLQQIYHGGVLDMALVFPGQTTGFTLAQYWAGVSPKLQAAGLSGIMNGLGMLVHAGRQWPEVATNPWNGGEWPAGGGFWWQGGAGRAVQ